MIEENKIKINFENKENKISKKLEVFYNPIMKFNRDCSIILLNSIVKKALIIGLPLSGSGIRGLRLLKELKKSKIKEIYFNDYKENFNNIIKQNIEINKIKINKEKIKVSNKDANIFILESKGFDYIDLDPFGTPNPFLDASVKRISREGILAITATDTSALAGTYPKATARKYFARPLRNYLMHETGLRILIRKIQLIGAQYDKALIPIFSYSKDHYYRIFFRNEKGKSKVDQILKQHKYFIYCPKCMNFFVDRFNQKECCNKRMEFVGPLWVGKLFDEKLTRKIKKSSYNNIIGIENKENIKFMDLLCKEALSNIDDVGFYEIPEIMKKYKINNCKKMDNTLNSLKKKKFKAVRTHFGKQGIKTNAKIEDVIKAMKN
jgi:tRNA (guanine26-N2/guanine27-N2)-dimethyltransferase